jgi:DNA-binding beta-propeller fold protein YncE
MRAGRHGQGGPAAAPAVLITVLVLAAGASAAGLAACSGRNGSSGSRSAAARILPEQVIPAPRALLAATGPQPDGTVWAVAGGASVGLYKLDGTDGHETSSVSVSQAARSVAETATGVVAIGLGSATSGALDIMQGTKKKARKTVSLPAPAVQVVTASAGSDFYALTAWPSSASVTTVTSRGKIIGTVPAPKDTVSIAVDQPHQLLYALQRNGVVDEIGLTNGSIQSTFTVDDPGESIAVSPDGSRLYVLKGTSSVSNIAVIDAATGGTLRVLPAPSHCVELQVSPTGQRLYEVVGSPGYGNIQVFGF